MCLPSVCSSLSAFRPLPPPLSRRRCKSTPSTLWSRPPCACHSGSCFQWGTPPTPLSSVTATCRSATWYNTQTHTHTHKKKHTNCHMHCLHLWHQRNRECQVSELNYIIGSLDFSTLPWRLSSVWPLTFSLSSPGESRVWGEPDRRGGGDVGHHHLGCSSLQPDWVPSLGSGQERHRQLITTDGTATRRDRRTAERPIGEMRNCFREERRRERYVPRRGFLFRCEPRQFFFN